MSKERRKDYSSLTGTLTSIQIDLRGMGTKYEEWHKHNKENIKNITGILEKLNKTVYGNGEEGLTTSIKLVKKDLATNFDNDRKSRIMSRGIGILIISLLTKLAFFN